MCTFLGPKVKYAICDRTPPNCTPNVVYMSAQVFRDSGVPPLWGVGVGGWGLDSVRMFGGVPRAHTCTHVRACAYMYKHVNFMQMAAPIGKSWGIPYDIIAHACACAHMHGGPPKQTESDRVPPTSTHPHPPKGGDPRISQNSIALELIEIFQFCLKI